MKKVLIVEDELLARVGLRQLVSWEELELELLEDAKDGQEAIDSICTNNPDIILLDLNSVCLKRATRTKFTETGCYAASSNSIN